MQRLPLDKQKEVSKLIKNRVDVEYYNFEYSKYLSGIYGTIPEEKVYVNTLLPITKTNLSFEYNNEKFEHEAKYDKYYTSTKDNVTVHDIAVALNICKNQKPKIFPLKGNAEFHKAEFDGKLIGDETESYYFIGSNKSINVYTELKVQKNSKITFTAINIASMDHNEDILSFGKYKYDYFNIKDIKDNNTINVEEDTEGTLTINPNYIKFLGIYNDNNNNIEHFWTISYPYFLKDQIGDNDLNCKELYYYYIIDLIMLSECLSFLKIFI